MSVLSILFKQAALSGSGVAPPFASEPEGAWQSIGQEQHPNQAYEPGVNDYPDVYPEPPAPAYVPGVNDYPDVYPPKNNYGPENPYGSFSQYADPSLDYLNDPNFDDLPPQGSEPYVQQQPSQFSEPPAAQPGSGYERTMLDPAWDPQALRVQDNEPAFDAGPVPPQPSMINAEFARRHGSNFDPQSRMDQARMRAIPQGPAMAAAQEQEYNHAQQQPQQMRQPPPQAEQPRPIRQPQQQTQPPPRPQQRWAEVPQAPQARPYRLPPRGPASQYQVHNAPRSDGYQARSQREIWDMEARNKAIRDHAAATRGPTNEDIAIAQSRYGNGRVAPVWWGYGVNNDGSPLTRQNLNNPQSWRNQGVAPGSSSAYNIPKNVQHLIASTPPRRRMGMRGRL